MPSVAVMRRDLAAADKRLAELKRKLSAQMLGKGYPEFDPDQPRDNHGMWARGGGAGGASRSRVGGGRKKPARAADPVRRKVRSALQRDRERMKRIGQDIERARTERERQEAAERTRREYDRIDREVREWPNEVWYDKGLADEIWGILTDLNFWLFTVGIPSLMGLTLPMMIYGITVAAVGSYLLMRYAYRRIKATVQGRTYGGVRRGFDDEV